MCGIAGIIKKHAKVDTVECVTAMLKAMKHRGPDEQRLVSSGNGVIGAARLAIRGLEDGTQPMTHTETGLVVVCNGEIDNHLELKEFLATQGYPVFAKNDVAVLIGLYQLLGANFVTKLRGSFAIAIWDPAHEKLLLIRDRAGERPLFYTEDEKGIFFASELAALIRGCGNRANLNVKAIHDYLRRGYFVAPFSAVEQIHKVPPATVLVFHADRIESHCYWQWTKEPIAKLQFCTKSALASSDSDLESKASFAIGSRAKKLKNRSDEEAFDRLFLNTVRAQSEIDVPYGIFLSGGVDSSLVAAVVRHLRPHDTIPAYTIRFEDSSFDEGKYAAQIASVLNLNNENIWIKADDFSRELPDLIMHTGEIIADPAWVPTALLAKRAAKKVKVVLGGEGADELFAGYPTYFAGQLANYYQRFPNCFKQLIKWVINQWPESEKKMTLGFLLKKFVAGAELTGLERHRVWNAAIEPVLLKQLGIKKEIVVNLKSSDELHLLQKEDLEHALAEGLLTKADRAGMRYAVEVRSPFLDNKVMEFAAGLDYNERVHFIHTKSFLKHYARRYLPKNIIYRRKRGLSIPLNAWLRGPLYSWAESYLDNPLLEEIGLDRAGLLVLLKAHKELKNDYARPIWTLIVLSAWLNWVRANN